MQKMNTEGPQRAQNSVVHLFAALWLLPLPKFVLNVHTFFCHFLYDFLFLIQP